MRRTIRSRRDRSSSSFPAGAALAELLESRRLLAGIEAGVLVARGTSSADTISLRRTGPDDVIVTTNGDEQTFDMDNFSGVRLEGLGGNDTFNLIDPLTSPLVRNTTVLGGGGSDTIDYSARTAPLTFSGYQSIDGVPFIRVTSGAQTDWVGPDVETLIGGAGNDTFDVSDNRQGYEEEVPAAVRFEGRGGNDLFDSGFGLVATLVGGPGDEVFESSENSVNHIFGGDGNDFVIVGTAGVPASYDGGSGIDGIQSWGDAEQEVWDLREYPGVENCTIEFGEIIGNDAPNLLIVALDDGDGGILTGGGGNDTLIGGSRVDAGEGDDSIVGSRNDINTLDGGPGFDIADGGPAPTTYHNVEVTPSEPRIRIEGRVLIADGSWGVDRIIAEKVNATTATVRVNQVERSFNLADFDAVLLRGNKGYDEVRVDGWQIGALGRPVTLIGGPGNDRLVGYEAAEVFLGSEGDDTLIGQGGADVLFGAFGDDFIYAGDGTDTVDGGPGNDTIRDAEVTPPPPRIRIDGRTLIADGSWGVDLLTIEPVAGDDDVIVRVTDTVRRFDTDDFDGVLLRGQAGFDVLHVLQPIRGLKVTLEGGDGYDTLLGSDGEEVLRGGTGNDLLRGFGGNDALFGNGGADRLDAGGGNDFLEALDGQPFDTLLGGDGADTAMIDAGDSASGVERFA